MQKSGVGTNSMVIKRRVDHLFIEDVPKICNLFEDEEQHKKIIPVNSIYVNIAALG